MAEEKNFGGIEITEVTVYPFKVVLGHIVGLADIVLNGVFIVRGLRIMRDSDGKLFVSYPLDPFYKGEEYKHVARPIVKELTEHIEKVVLDELRKLRGED